MKELSLAIDNFLLRIFEAIEKDDSMALDSLIRNNRDLLSRAASEKYLVLETFKRNAPNCMKLLLETLDFDSKEAQVRAVENYILERLNQSSQPPELIELDCIQLLSLPSVEDKIFELNSSHIKPSEHLVFFRAYLRSKSLTPLEYLSFSVNEEEKLLCLTLLT